MKFFAWLLSTLSGWRWKSQRVGDCLKVLPVLRAQLTEVAQQVERGVVGVCNNFSGIADRSRKAVEKTTELFGEGQGEQDGTVEQSIETSRATIGGLLERLERASQISAMVVSRMEQVEQGVSGIESLLSELQKIAFSNKLVALNAKIEAVHVGQLGAGFEVVADEISRQGDKSNELAEAIGVRVREMRDRINTAAGDLRTIVAQDRDQLAESRHVAESALDVLRSVHQRARDSLAWMASEQQDLAGEISNAVVGLQFQDRTNQCIEHVLEGLLQVEQNLGGASQSATAPSPGGGKGRSMLDEVRDGYTMESERAVLQRALAETPAATDEGGDVELF